LIVAGETRVLVDAGLSAKRDRAPARHRRRGRAKTRLRFWSRMNMATTAGGLRVLLRTVDCPVYISAQTSDAYISERTNVNDEEPRKPPPGPLRIASSK